MGSPLTHKPCQRHTLNFLNLDGSGNGKRTQPTAIHPERGQWGQLPRRLGKAGEREVLPLSCKLLIYREFLCLVAQIVDKAILY